MKKTPLPRAPLAIALVVISIALVVIWWRSDAGRLAPPDPLKTAASPTARDPLHGTAREHPEDLEHRRTEPPAEGSLPSPPPPNRIVLEGRCVDATGSPVAGIQASVQVGHQPRSPAPTSLPEPQRTAADGRFRLSLPTIVDREVYLTLGSPRHVELTRTLCLVESSRDFGDIQVQTGSLLRGRLQDSEGIRLGGYTLRLGRSEEPRDAFMAPGIFIGSTRADGTFEVGPLPPGEFPLAVPGCVLLAPRVIRIPPGGSPVDQLLVAHSTKSWPAITGFLRDEEGQPIANARIITTPMIRAAIHRTDADGRFRIMKPEKKASPERIRVGAIRAGFAHLEPSTSATWGDHAVQLRMHSVPALEIRVTDAEGVPTPGFDVWLSRPSSFMHRFGHRTPPWAKGPFREGKAILAQLRDGDYLVKVLPHSAAWDESNFYPVQMEPGVPVRLDVRLRPAARRRVRVRRENGNPVAAAQVELIERHGEEAITPDTLVLRSGSSSRSKWPYLRCHGSTSTAGVVELHGNPETVYALRIRSPRFPTQVVRGVRLSPGQPTLEIVIPQGAVLEGQIEPREFLTWTRASRAYNSLEQESLVLRQTRPDGVLTRPGRNEPPLLIEPDGSFLVEGLEPGDWNLSLRITRPHRLSWTWQSVGLGTVKNLGPQERRRIRLDMTDKMPQPVALRALINGEPFDGKEMILVGPQRRHRISRAADGRFRVDLPPGRYRVHVVLDGMAVPTPALVESPSPAPVTTVRLDVRTVSWTIRSEQGHALKNVKLWFESGADRTYRLGNRTSARRPLGRLRIFTAPRRSAGGVAEQVELVDVQLTPGEGPVKLKLVIPDELGYERSGP